MTLTSAILGHILAGFIGGAVNFCLGHWMASRTYGRAFAELEKRVIHQGAVVNTLIEHWGQQQ